MDEGDHQVENPNPVVACRMSSKFLRLRAQKMPIERVIFMGAPMSGDRFITLKKVVTSKTQRPVDVQVGRITYVEPHRIGSYVHFGPDDLVHVKESADEVLRLIAEGQA
jgi:hypothetical protein